MYRNNTTGLFLQIRERFKMFRELMNACFKTVLVAGLVLTTLLGCAGCASNMPFEDPNDVSGTQGSNSLEHGSKHEPFEELPVRSKEEIEATGITAEDVLALYDQLASDIWHTRYKKEDLKAQYEKYYDSITVQFDSVSPNIFSHSVLDDKGQYITEAVEYPFYVKCQGYRPNHQWFNPNGTLSHITPESMGNDVYTVTFRLNFVLDDKVYNAKYTGFGIENNEFNNVMNSLNVESSTLTKDQFLFAGSPLFFMNYLGETTYAPVTITRNEIFNATEEQLWALYIMANSMRIINLEGKMP